MYCVLFILPCIVYFTFYTCIVYFPCIDYFTLFISGNSVDDRDCTFVFPSAGIGVVQELDIMDDTSTSTQSFLGNTTPNTPTPQFAHSRHTDDIISICVSANNLR